MSTTSDGGVAGAGGPMMPTAGGKRLVRVWLGQHVIIRHENDTAGASAFEVAMQRRYSSCRVTNDPAR
jgi:hypothetical protein